MQCHVALGKIAIFYPHEEYYQIVDTTGNDDVREFPIRQNGNLALSEVSTVVLYSFYAKYQNYDSNSAQPVGSVFTHLTRHFDELIVVGEVPESYLKMLHVHNKLRGLKRISLHSHNSNFFDTPCNICPFLEEMTVERNGLKEVSLNSCKYLQKVWIWNVKDATQIVSTPNMNKNRATFSRKSSIRSADTHIVLILLNGLQQTRNVPHRQQAKNIMNGINHALHEAKSKALKWNRALSSYEVDKYDV